MVVCIRCLASPDYFTPPPIQRLPDNSLSSSSQSGFSYFHISSNVSMPQKPKVLIFSYKCSKSSTNSSILCPPSSASLCFQLKYILCSANNEELKTGGGEKNYHTINVERDISLVRRQDQFPEVGHGPRFSIITTTGYYHHHQRHHHRHHQHHRQHQHRHRLQ